MVAGLTSNTERPVLKTIALQGIFKLNGNTTWQNPALLRQHTLEPGPVFLDQLTEKGALRLTSLILKWTVGPKIVLECI
jgi:hypothetical protein